MWSAEARKSHARIDSAPGVMVSSTFYDLRQVREDLRRFIADELGYPVSLGEAWRLRKMSCGSAKEAICELFSHQLTLTAKGELLASQVCRNNEQILTTQEQWKAAMIDKGWQ